MQLNAPTPHHILVRQQPPSLIILMSISILNPSPFYEHCNTFTIGCIEIMSMNDCGS